MKLTIAQIRSIVTGAVSVEEKQDGICFCRFTREQLSLYEKRNPTFYKKCKTTAGIKLSFATNSHWLKLKFFVEGHIGASFMAFDVFVNGKMIGSLNNFDGVDFPRNYLKTQFPIGDFSGSFALGDGEKQVTVHLPWNGYIYLRKMAIEDGATLMPVKPSGKLLALGDSITYGNAAMHPSSRYIARLCSALGVEEYNKGIGGEFFFPALASTKESFTPDYIVVAYGTNDWRKHPRDVFFTDVKDFFHALDQTYPGIKTYVITPTWRSNLHVETDFSSMDEVSTAIRDAARVLQNATVIDGFTLVPHDVAFYGDYGCHPNDLGFDKYFENLWAQIKE